MKYPKRIVSGVLLIFCIVQTGWVDDWPQYRGPHRNGYSDETGLKLTWGTDGPSELWRFPIGIGFSSFAVNDGKLYTMGYKENKDFVWCLDANTGEEIWNYSYLETRFDKSHEGGPGSTPSTDGEFVYTLSRMALLHCLDAKTGTLVWHKDLKRDFSTDIPTWGYTCSPLIEGDLLIVDAGHTVAFNKKNGDVVWKSRTNYKPGYSAPMTFELDGKRVVAVFNRYGLVVLSLEDGSELFKYPWPTNHGVNSCVPIIHGKQVYISSSYGQGSGLIDLSGSQATAKWTSKQLENHFNASIFLNGYLYGFNGHYGRATVSFTCTEIDTGKIVWDEPSISRGSVIYADGKLIALTGQGELVVIDPSPDQYKELARAQILGGKCWSEPALSNKKLYARSAQGLLVCLDLHP